VAVISATRHSRCLHVLLAEDSLVNQKLATALLDKWGHRISVAGNGRDAIDRWLSGRFDVILMDVQMPELDGLEATRTIRRQEQSTGEHIPIIAMTAHALKGDEERCLAAGMDAYISKPIRAPLLFQRLAELCTALDDAEGIQPVTSDGAATLLDRAGLLELTGGDEPLLREVLEAMTEEAPQMLAILDAAIAARNEEESHRAAHTVLGHMRTLGYDPGMQRARTVEKLASDGDFEALAGPVKELHQSVATAMQGVREILKG